MATVDKLIKRLKTVPKDFTFDELRTVLESLGFVMSNRGKSSGSAVRFSKGITVINLHKPHPRKELLQSQIKDVLNVLGEDGLI